ncbi:hypothetical protein [Acinetobacter baumannii]|uniref:hypothetical protein n=1 Tax=Acinetobacter baumannii TaxID=470 RepID=UPI003CC5A449
MVLTSCGKKYMITPDSLPIAHVNQEYRQLIQISGGKVSDTRSPLKTDVPENLGITILPANDRDGYNIIEVKGIPKYEGIFTIHILAGFYAGGGKEIKKTYNLKVEK